MKAAWRERLTTVFPRQGHYALDPADRRRYPPADITVERIGDLADLDVANLLDAPAGAVAGHHRREHESQHPTSCTTSARASGSTTSRREILANGTLARYIAELSVTGLTSNPTIFEKAIGSGSFYDDGIRATAARRAGRARTCSSSWRWRTCTQAADLFRPVHDATGGVDGWVSLEVSPLLADDTASTVAGRGAAARGRRAAEPVHQDSRARRPASRRSRSRSSPACRST